MAGVVAKQSMNCGAGSVKDCSDKRHEARFSFFKKNIDMIATDVI